MVNEISIGTRIPTNLVTKVQVITAKRDSGKSYTGGVEEEEFIKHDLPFVVISGMKAHNGIRSKFPIPVIGPIDKKSKEFQPDMHIGVEDGKDIAKLIVEQNLTCILYIGNWRKADQQIFTADFLDEIFYINNSPRQIFVEEADVFAPQTKSTEQSKVSRKALDEVVRRGRERGLGVTLITQRPAVLDKDILTQADVYLIGNFIADQDLTAIGKVLTHNGSLSKKDLKTLIKKISSFDQGEFLLYSPSWLKKTKIFKVKKRKGAHSGATPEFGKPQTWKPLPVNVDHYINRLELIKNPIEEEREEKPEINMDNVKAATVGIVMIATAISIILFRVL